MNLYESIKKNQLIKESTNWQELKDGLSSCKSADDLQSLMYSSMDGNDFSTYCDYVYEINNNSDLQWAKKELKQLADSKIKESKQIDKTTSEFKNLISKYFKEFDSIISNLGGSTNYEYNKPNHVVMHYNLAAPLNSLTKPAKDKEKELTNLILSYDPKNGVSYNKELAGSFLITLYTEDNAFKDTFSCYFSLYTPALIKYYKYSNKSIDEDDIPLRDIDKVVSKVLKDAKDSLTKLFESFDIDDYIQWLDTQIELYKNKIQKRENRKQSKEKAISQDMNLVRLSKQNLIDIIDQQTNISSDIFNRQVGSFYIKGTLPDGHKTLITVKLFGGLAPGEFGFEIPETTKNPKFKKHCVDSLVSGLNATQGPDRENHAYGHHGETVAKTYIAPVSNLLKLPNIIKKLSSELSSTIN